MKIAKLANQGKDTTAPKSPFDNHRRPSPERTRHSSIHYINESPVLRHSILNLHWLIWIFFVSSYFEFSVGEASSPLNRAAIKGDKVQLDCSTTEKENGYWMHTKPLESDQRRIYNGDKVANDLRALFYVNDSVQGHFNLIFNASESTSGQYTCQPSILAADQSAEVIVLDTSPNCSMVEAPGFLTASCSIEFTGNWEPEIQWYSMKGRLETNGTNTVQNRIVTSLLIVPHNQSETGLFDILTCTTTFAQEKKPRETTATNVPILLRSCSLTIGSPPDDSSTQPTTTTNAAVPPSAPLNTVGIVVGLCLGVAAVIIAVVSVFLCKRIKFTRRSMKKDPSEVVPMAKTA